MKLVWKPIVALLALTGIIMGFIVPNMHKAPKKEVLKRRYYKKKKPVLSDEEKSLKSGRVDHRTGVLQESANSILKFEPTIEGNQLVAGEMKVSKLLSKKSDETSREQFDTVVEIMKFDPLIYSRAIQFEPVEDEIQLEYTDADLVLDTLATQDTVTVEASADD